MVKTFPPIKKNYPLTKDFEENNSQCGSILKWKEVSTEVIYHTETVKQITMKSGVATVLSLVDENGMSIKVFTTSCLEKDLVNFD